MKKPKGYWSFERCKDSALKYNTKMEWKNGDGGAYDYAYRQKWLSKICSHM